MTTLTTKLSMLATYQMNFVVRSSGDPVTKETDIEIYAGGEESTPEAFSFVFTSEETDGQGADEVKLMARKVAHHALIFAMEKAIGRVQDSLDRLSNEVPITTVFPQSGGASA
jgi:hypothetical protein